MEYLWNTKIPLGKAYFQGRFVGFREGIILIVQWLFLVPSKGGRDYTIPKKAIYKWYISGIYCQLGHYMLPTTF